MNEKFKDLLIKNHQNFIVKSSFAGIIFLGMLILFVLIGIKVSFDPMFPFIIIAIFFGMAVIFAIRKDIGSFKGYTFWIKMIHENPEKIVWIKPIRVKHTIGLIVTAFKEQKYQILTIDKLTVTIKCNTDLENHIFLKVIKLNVPFVHVGYSEDIEDLFKSDPKNFIKNLKNQGLYNPINLI